MYTGREADLIISIISKKTGIKLVRTGVNWSADVKRKIIFYPKNSILDDETLSYLIHEASHIRFTEIDNKYVDSCKTISEKNNKNPEQIFFLINACEDLRIEKLISDIYPGAKKLLEKGSIQTHKKILSKYYKYMAPELKSIQEMRASNFCYALFMREYIDEEYNEEFLAFCDKKTNKVYQKLKEHSTIIKNFSNFTEMVKYVIKNVMPLYLTLCDDIKKESKKDKEKGEKGDENNEKNDEDETKSEKKSSEEKTNKMLKDLLDAIRDMEKREEDGEEIETDTMNTGGRAKMEDDEKKKEFGGFGGGKKFDRQELEDLFGIDCNSRAFTYEQFITEVKKMVPMLRKPISILKDLEFKREVGGFESGKINMRKINKLFTGYSRIFKRPSDVKLDDKDLAISILVDESGSMKDYSKDKVAAISCGAIAMSLESAGKKFSIFGFNEYFKTHKSFNSRVYLPELYNIYLNASRDGAGDNNDGYAVKRATKELMKSPQKNKILIVLSDGQPAPSYGDSDEGIRYGDYILKDEVKKAEKLVKVYSIGILSNAVSNYYNEKTTFVINNIMELPKHMFNILNKTVGKRLR